MLETSDSDIVQMHSNSKNKQTSQTRTLNATRPASSNLAEVSFVCERSLILLSHTPQGGMFSTGSVPVFAVSPHKAPGTPKKKKNRLFCFLRPLATTPPSRSEHLFVAVFDLLSHQQFSFLWGRAMCGRGFSPFVFSKNHKISLIFDTFYITKRETDVPVLITGCFC